MKKINWVAIAVFGVVVLLVFLAGVSLLGGWGYSGWGMMGPGMMGGWGFSPFGWVGMIFMWLIPLGFVVLTVLGVAWLVRAMGGRANKDAPGQICPSCGRGIQADWNNCPDCGASLVK